MVDMTLAEAIDYCPFRSVVSPSGRLEPILGCWAIVEGPALPMPKQAVDDAADAFRRGGSFLILAVNRADRDAAKAALLLRFRTPEGRA